MVFYLTATPKLDPYSGEAVGEDWSEPVRVEAPAAFVLSGSTSAAVDGGNQTVAQTWTLYVPEGEVSPPVGARVEADGVLFKQEGRAVRERNPFTGWAPYAQVRLSMAGGKG